MGEPKTNWWTGDPDVVTWEDVQLARALTSPTRAHLEHTGVVLINTHRDGDCVGEWCTLHHRSDHSMRGFPQTWNDRVGMMMRVCPHGVRHPDPDDYKMGVDPGLFGVHLCDGCC